MSFIVSVSLLSDAITTWIIVHQISFIILLFCTLRYLSPSGLMSSVMSFLILAILPLDVIIPWCFSLSQSSYLLMSFILIITLSVVFHHLDHSTVFCLSSSWSLWSIVILYHLSHCIVWCLLLALSLVYLFFIIFIISVSDVLIISITIFTDVFIIKHCNDVAFDNFLIILPSDVFIILIIVSSDVLTISTIAFSDVFDHLDQHIVWHFVLPWLLLLLSHSNRTASLSFN